MIHLDNNQPLMLVAGYKNILFIVDKANRRYKFVIEDEESIRTHNNIIMLQEITSTTEKLEGLEKELKVK